MLQAAATGPGVLAWRMLVASREQRSIALEADARHLFTDVWTSAGVVAGPGISVKLSALHPRYSRAQHARVMGELLPRLKNLLMLAKQYDIGLNIDAEEADRLEISLDLLEKLCFDPSLADWNGIGFVVQAYQKRARAAIAMIGDSTASGCSSLWMPS